METYALDYETYYDKACSIRTLGPLGYFSHHDFDAYMVSVVGTDGTSFVGHPRDFQWDLLTDNVVISHNASFDETLYLYGVTQSWWPEVKPAEWHCTADMAAYMHMPRALKGAAKFALGIEVDKSTRDNMSGKRWEKMTDEFRKEVSDYALVDSQLCLDLWKEHGWAWPDKERQISRLNREIVQRGLPIDADLLRAQLETIKGKLFEAEESIPWLGDKPLLSRVAFDDQCRTEGIEPPGSLAATDEEAQKWIDYYGKKHAWIDAVRSWRRINSLKKKLESFDHATMPDSRYYGGLMYYGAHTGRFSGSGGNLNLQNLPREEMFGVNLRNLIAAKPGKKLIVADLSQIEVRTLCWLAEDKKMLKEIEQSEDIYEAFAIRFGQWDTEKGSLKQDPKLRHKIKAMVLGCGYGAGKKRFSQMAGMTQKEANSAVDLYRNSMRSITRLWSDYSSGISCAYNLTVNGAETPFIVDLPSGRHLNYGFIRSDGKGEDRHYYAYLMRHGKNVAVKMWGGFVAENASQALARDIFSDMLVRIDEAGYKIVLHVHDEVVIEADADKAEESLEHILKIMSEPPDWIPDIPLAAEGSILSRYTK